MRDSLERFTISIPAGLLRSFDTVCASKGYASRSEAVRDAIRDYLAAHNWGVEGDTREMVGTITLVYDHQVRGLSDDLRKRQR